MDTFKRRRLLVSYRGLLTGLNITPKAVRAAGLVLEAV